MRNVYNISYQKIRLFLDIYTITGRHFMSLKKITFICGMFCLFFSAQIEIVFSQETIDKPANFIEVVESRLKKTYGISLEEICPIETDPAANRVFREYGAIFVSDNGGKIPARCIFDDETQVGAFQSQINPKTVVVGGTSVTLQESAMNALLEAVKDAAKKKLRISPRGGSLAAARSYRDTERLWYTRFFPALAYWVGKGKIPRQEADNAKSLLIHQQVVQVLEWESKGFYFSKDLSKSILFSVAAPGASQHIFMLALDVEQFANKNVREILADHGWFQTVQSDLPHFTYLGVRESELPALGLKKVTHGGQIFWIPNVIDSPKTEVKEK